MSNPTDPQTGRQNSTEPIEASQDGAQPTEVHPHGYTLADEEIERVAAKLNAGNVLDPIALNDPVGQSVEHVIMRVGVAVVAILVAGILLAQIACKNIQLSGIPDFSSQAVTGESVQGALSSGISWGGTVVHYPEVVSASFDLSDATVTVVVENTSARTFEQLAAAAQEQASALAMNLFRDANVQRVSYAVRSTVDPETGSFSVANGADTRSDVLTIVWERSGDAASFTCSMTGFDPNETSVAAGIENKAAVA